MMNSIRLGALVIFLAGGQAIGQTSKISYTLELGGNNHATGPAPSWENPVACIPPAFTSGSTSDGQSFIGTVVTWAARVFVTGTHSNTFAPSGAANLVANLELHHDSATGPLVNIGHGSPVSAGWFSSINDGDADGTRGASAVSGGCEFGADPLEDAAFAVAYDIREFGYAGPPRARVIDGPADAGPFLDYFMYPSTAGHPAGSTVSSGRLLGIGAGYSRYAGYGCPGDCGGGNGLNTAGVGRTTAASCGVLLGSGPVFEGQINTSGLLSGTYVLVLTPGSGNNIVNGNFLCDSADPGAFALSPDLASDGDSITFVFIQPDSFPLPILQWKSVRTHGNSPGTEYAITLNPAATGNGSSGPTVECRGPTINPCIRKIQVDFGGNVILVNPNNVTCEYRLTTQGGTPTLGGPIAIVPASVNMADADTLNIIFADGAVPDLSCLTITIGAGTFAQTITGDTDCSVRSLLADVNGDGRVTTTDQLFVKTKIPAPFDPRSDLNVSGTVTTTDQLFVKTQIISPIKTALCP